MMLSRNRSFGLILILMVFSVWIHGCSKDFHSEVSELSGSKPWTNLNFNSPIMRFAVLADRTNNARPGIFEGAIGKVQLLEPDFVMCVGDLIQGYNMTEEQVADDWKRVNDTLASLTMPFFYVPGNHDWNNDITCNAYKNLFGKDYYHFVYKNVLFLVVNTAPVQDKKTYISDEQIEYFRSVLSSNRNVVWTFVFTHKPAWKEKFTCENWNRLESLLAGRNYTMFAGHEHIYNKMVVNGHTRYGLSVTGARLPDDGPPNAKLDLITWVTVYKTGPVVVNLQPDYILDDNLKR
jgi:hypothetical protein